MIIVPSHSNNNGLLYPKAITPTNDKCFKYHITSGRVLVISCCLQASSVINPTDILQGNKQEIAGIRWTVNVTCNAPFIYDGIFPQNSCYQNKRMILSTSKYSRLVRRQLYTVMLMF